MKIKLIKSSFYNEQDTKDALCEFIQSAEYLSMSEQCKSFEDNFSHWQGRKYSVFFNSGSSANLALIQALINKKQLKQSAICGFSAITWATNVMPFLQYGLKVVPVDISLSTLNVSPEILREAHEKYGLDCLFLTNLLGFADDLAEIKRYCKKHKILLIEDNCESLGSVIDGVKLGNFSLASTFSFFVGHHMSTIEGGMVCTDDKELYEELIMVRSHGWDRHLVERTQDQLRKEHSVSDFYAKYTFYDLAYNLRPTEISGFLGNYQLQFLDETITKRVNNFNNLKQLYQSEKYLPLDVSHMEVVSNFAVPIVCKTKESFTKTILDADKHEIEVRPIVGGVMPDQPFFKKYVAEVFEVPNARTINETGFYFGNNPELTNEEITFMLKVFGS